MGGWVGGWVGGWMDGWMLTPRFRPFLIFYCQDPGRSPPIHFEKDVIEIKLKVGVEVDIIF